MSTLDKRLAQLEQRQQPAPQPDPLPSFPHDEHARLFAAAVEEFGATQVLEEMQHHLMATLAEYSGGGAA